MINQYKYSYITNCVNFNSLHTLHIKYWIQFFLDTSHAYSSALIHLNETLLYWKRYLWLYKLIIQNNQRTFFGLLMSNLERTNVGEMDSEALSIELSTVISRRYLWIIKRICTIRKTLNPSPRKHSRLISW